MAKQIFHVDVQNGHLWRFDGTSWTKIIATTPTGWVVDNANPDRRSSNGVIASLKGQPYLIYRSAQQTLIVPIVNWDTYNEAGAIVDGIVDSTEIWSNMVQYKNLLVWLSWPSTINGVSIYTFDGTTITRYTITPNPGAAQWTAYTKATPQVGGMLFVHDEELFFGPRGLFGEQPTRSHNHLFKIDIGSAVANYILYDLNRNLAEQYSLTNPWLSVEPEAQSLTLGVCEDFRYAAMTVGTHKGDLYVLNADGRLDRMDTLSGLRTQCLDIRSAPGMLAKQLMSVYPSSKEQSFSLIAKTDLAADNTGLLPFLGGRVDVTLSGVEHQGTLRGMWTPSQGRIEFGVQGLEGADDFPQLTLGNRIDVRYGFCGTLDSTADLWNEGGSASALILSDDNYLYLITGVSCPRAVGNQANRHAPLIVTKWSGNLEDQPTYLTVWDNGAQANVSGMDAYLDKDVNLLHILWSDLKTNSVKHVVVNLANFTQTPVRTITTLPNSNFPGAVKPGGAFGFAPNQPEVLPVSSTYDFAERVMVLNYHLHTQSSQGLSNLNLQVEFNIGGEWIAATPKDSDPRHSGTTGLSATIAGENYNFVHDTIEQLRDFAGLIQYRFKATT